MSDRDTPYLFALDETTVLALADGHCPEWLQVAAVEMLRGVVPYLPLDDEDAAFLAGHRAKQHREADRLRKVNAGLRVHVEKQAKATA